MMLLRNIFKFQSNYYRFSSKFQSNFERIPSKLITCNLCTLRKKNTIGNIVKYWRQEFENNSIDPIESIEYIVAHVIGTKKKRQLGSQQEKELTTDEMEKIEMLSKRRLERIPVQYLIGEWEFRDITLKLVPPIFIPEPQTEMLIDFVLQRVSNSNFDSCEVLEVGCSTGAIILSLLNACNKIRAMALDTNINACNLTLENARTLKLDDRITVINATLQEDGTIKNSPEEKSIDLNKKKLDIIVSNPPYVTTKQYVKFPPEIKLHEDVRATDGGPDGLRVVKPLLNYSANALKPGGRLFIEINPVNSEYIPFYTAMNTKLKLKHEHTYKRFIKLRSICRTFEINLAQKN